MYEFILFFIGLILGIFIVIAHHSDLCLNNIYNCESVSCKKHINTFRELCVTNDATACLLLYKITTDQLEKESAQKRIKQLVQPIINN